LKSSYPCTSSTCGQFNSAPRLCISMRRSRHKDHESTHDLWLHLGSLPRIWPSVYPSILWGWFLIYSVAWTWELHVSPDLYLPLSRLPVPISPLYNESLKR
jgi:hypothetical protein